MALAVGSKGGFGDPKISDYLQDTYHDSEVIDPVNSHGKEM